MLKPGYKQTAVGLIPNEWEEESLGNVIQLQRGFDLPHHSRKNGTVPIISSAGKYDTHSYAMVSAPGVVTGRYGTIGEVFYIKEDFWPLNTTLFVKDFKENSPHFVFYLLKTVDFAAHSGKSGVPGVNRNDLHELLVALPPITEQNAIANTLGVVDALLQEQRDLLAKKRYLKQATQQALLTQERRLQGFSGEWEEKTLGQLGRTYGGLTGKSKLDFHEGTSPYIPFMNVMSNVIIDKHYFDYVKIKPGEKQNKVIKGDLLFNTSSETPEEVGMCSVLDADIPNLYLNSFCFGFRIHNSEEVNGLFLTQYLRSEVGRTLFYSTAQGATRYNLSKSNFNKLEVLLPTIVEQRAIVALLSSMDKEIAGLSQQLAKTEALKQGLMQDLLTGTIRLTKATSTTTV